MRPLVRIVLTSVLTVACISAGSAATAGCHGRSGGYSAGRHFGGGSYARIPHYVAPVYSHPRHVVVRPPQVIYAPAPQDVPGSESGNRQQEFVGRWTARPGNGATIRLTLAADGRFEWSAVNAAGKATTFQGSYSIENGSLSLARSNDSQRLTGRMTSNGAETFKFQLAEDNAANLEFRRG